MNFSAVNDRVVIRRKDPLSTSSGGIVIANVAQETPGEGTVVAVGPGAKSAKDVLIPTTVKVGDHVLFSKASGIPTQIEGEDLLIMKEEEIFAVLED